MFHEICHILTLLYVSEIDQTSEYEACIKQVSTTVLLVYYRCITITVYTKEMSPEAASLL
jgi:hypothetical protein